MDTQANERGLTPKPLHEHVPGGWNFVEPNPNAITTQNWGADTIITIPEPMEMRIKLDHGSRLRLAAALEQIGLGEVDTMLSSYADRPDDDDWRLLEDALTEIFMPPARFVTGVSPR